MEYAALISDSENLIQYQTLLRKYERWNLIRQILNQIFKILSLMV